MSAIKRALRRAELEHGAELKGAKDEAASAIERARRAVQRLVLGAGEDFETAFEPEVDPDDDGLEGHFPWPKRKK